MPPDHPDRDALLAEWLRLTRETLPAMARAQAWPVHADHCFMRICLDLAFGKPWREALPAPAIRHITSPDLARAVSLARDFVRHPDRLIPANRRSLELRGKSGRRE